MKEGGESIGIKCPCEAKNPSRACGPSSVDENLLDPSVRVDPGCAVVHAVNRAFTKAAAPFQHRALETPLAVLELGIAKL